MLEGMDGGMPNHTTVDWVEGASHDNAAMMNSAEGTDKVSITCVTRFPENLIVPIAVPLLLQR